MGQRARRVTVVRDQPRQPGMGFSKVGGDTESRAAGRNGVALTPGGFLRLGKVKVSIEMIGLGADRLADQPDRLIMAALRKGDGPGQVERIGMVRRGGKRAGVQRSGLVKTRGAMGIEPGEHQGVGIVGGLGHELRGLQRKTGGASQRRRSILNPK